MHSSLSAHDSLLAPGTRRMKSRLQIDFKTTVQLVLEAGTCPVPHCTPACDSGPGTRSGRGGQGITFQNPQGWDSPQVWGRNQLLRHLFSSSKCASASFSVLIPVSPPTKEGPPHTLGPSRVPGYPVSLLPWQPPGTRCLLLPDEILRPGAVAPLLLSSVLYLPRLRGSHGEVILLDVHPWWMGSWNPPPAVAFPNKRE